MVSFKTCSEPEPSTPQALIPEVPSVFLKMFLRAKFMVVWEMDYKEDKLKTIDACLEFLGLKKNIIEI